MNNEFDSSRILHQDENCVVVNKKIGEAMEGAAKGMVDLGKLLDRFFNGDVASATKNVSPVAVHRLDVPVSGCALFARKPEALTTLNKAFADGAAHKIYWAIVEAPPEEPPSFVEFVELEHWLSIDPKTNKSRVHGEPGDGRKRAKLRYRLVGRGERYWFVEVELITGRHHQIRAQLAAVGLIIKGDLKYGARRSEVGGGIRLHARSLAFPDYARTGSFIQVVAPVPIKDALWTAFEAAAGGSA